MLKVKTQKSKLEKTSENCLVVSNLRVNIEDKEIIRGINLQIKEGEFHVIMGPNGSGKSTLTYALMGHPSYKITDQRSQIAVGRKSILELQPEERAKLGLMLAFQNPISIPGVTLSSFLRIAYQELYGTHISVLDFHKNMQLQAAKLAIDPSFLKRAINDGFSGGEKKKAEILQLLVLKPKIAIFDEIDTGLDIDALKIVALGIDELQQMGTGILLITHYQRILNFVRPQFVHVMKDGQFVKEGGPELARRIEKKGYANI